jgi:hypothetical protein
MNFNTDLLKLIQDHGIKGVIFVLVMILLYGMGKSKWLGLWLSKMSDKFVERFIKKETKDINTGVRKINDSDITNHDIFNYIDFWTYSKVPTFQFSTEFRTAVFRKYLTIYLKNYKRNIEKFLADKSYETMDEPQILKGFLNLINQTVYDYEREMVEVGITPIIIEKMKVKNNDNISLTIDLVEGVCSSQFYNSENNLLKIYSILNILLTVLESTVNNAEGVCNTINGQLKGMEFNGYVEPGGKNDIK